MDPDCPGGTARYRHHCVRTFKYPSLDTYRPRTKAFSARKASCSFLKSSFTAVVFPPASRNTTYTTELQYPLLHPSNIISIPDHVRYTLANWVLEDVRESEPNEDKRVCKPRTFKTFPVVRGKGNREGDPIIHDNRAEALACRIGRWDLAIDKGYFGSMGNYQNAPVESVLCAIARGIARGMTDRRLVMVGLARERNGTRRTSRQIAPLLGSIGGVGLQMSNLPLSCG